MAETPPLVSTEWLARHLEDSGIVVLDASVFLAPSADGGPREFQSGLDSFETNGHIPGSRFADLFTEFSDPTANLPFTRPQAKQFEAAAGRLGITPESHVVVYDGLTNQWAARLWWVFRSFGHARISVLDGGLRKYLKEARALEHKLSPYTQTAYVALRSKQIVATRDEVLQIVRGNASAELVCFLLPEDYAGITSVRARPGHIPGSENLPFSELVSDDNTLKRPDELRARFSSVTNLDGGLIVTYCGGGIASTLGALALAVIGYDNTREYDGSLAEWAEDPELPLELGS